MTGSLRASPTLLFFALLATLALACGGDDNESTDTNGSSTAADRNRALLESLGTHPQAVFVREYVTSKGAVGREYGTFGDLADAPTAVTAFYRDKLRAQGWEATQEHAAVSAYSKGRAPTMSRVGSLAIGVPGSSDGRSTIP